MSKELKGSDYVKATTNLNTADSDYSKAAYGFQVFLTDYYRRVKKDYKLDYDSFMIIMVVLQHSIYELNKEKTHQTLDHLKNEILQTSEEGYFKEKNRKLGAGNISNVLEIPDETARRKIASLIKMKILEKSKQDGIILGKNFVERHSKFADQTLKSLKGFIRNLNKTGVLKNILEE